MYARIARVSAAALCAAALLCSLAAPAGAAPKARSSVIGGAPASLGEWGFTVAILTPETLCTGSVIAPTKVLTAAHCAGNPAQTLVRANTTSAFTGGETLGIASAALEPGFQGFFADIAVLTLKSPTTAPPVTLATAAENASFTQPGAPLAVAGFGLRNPLIVGKPKFGALTTANVTARRCRAPSWVICDFGKRAGQAVRRFRGGLQLRRPVRRSICQGDSGGPLIARTPAGPRLIGIAEATSSPPKRNPFFFVRCGLEGFPSIHTRVTNFIDFINANLVAP
jgi:secreted trypsin-like serine protease